MSLPPCLVPHVHVASSSLSLVPPPLRAVVCLRRGRRGTMHIDYWASVICMPGISGMQRQS